MKTLNKTPLAFKNLTHSLRRLMAALAGVGFAVVLMFMQRGFQNALFDSTVKVVADLDADLLIVSSAQYALPARVSFPRSRLAQAEGCPGVARVYPFYMETVFGVLKPPEKKPHPIRVLAFHLEDPVCLIPEVNAQLDALRQPNTALIDERRKSKYGIPYDVNEIRNLRGVELADQSIRLVGTFPLGTDFANDGNLVMSAENFARYFYFRSPGEDPLASVDLGIVRLRPGADAQTVRDEVRRRLEGTGLTAFTKDEFITKEIGFWDNSTPVGYIFFIGTIMGFVVGVIICYQVIYSSIADQMAEFATLKAMGYRNRFFIRIVLETSLYLSIISYIPGLLVSLGIYWGLAYSTGLLLDMSWQQAALVFLLTLGMCTISGCLAMRKVLGADPADLF